jgi:hypothetical protein
MLNRILNLSGFQVGWFLCVLSPSYGLLYVGEIWIGLYILFTLSQLQDKQSAFFRILVIGTFGATTDGILAQFGIISFPTAMESWTPTYLYAIWYGFAAALEIPLNWLKGRYGLASILAFVFGPLNYLAGANLGAINFIFPQNTTLLIIAVSWAIQLPLLLAIANTLTNKSMLKASKYSALD